MRASIVAGGLLAIAVVLVIVVSSDLGLQVESYAFAGVLVGGVVGLVADASPWGRLGAFAVGFVAAWVGYLLRAGVFPDSTAGLVVSTLVSLGLCLLVAVLARRVLPLWAVLLGAGFFAAAYERVFTAAVPEVATTSVDAATSLALVVVVGFVAAALALPRHGELRTAGRKKVAA